MADRPILFSAPMVRALLDGRKTQTRRPFKAQYGFGDPVNLKDHGVGNYSGLPNDPQSWGFPFAEDGSDASLWNFPDLSGFRRGMKLWVRESYYQQGHWEPVPGVQTKGGRQKWAFVPTGPVSFDAPAEFRLGRHRKDPATVVWHKRLGRFMPRAASRLTLLVTDVRVERLQDCSENDAIAEGIHREHVILGATCAGGVHTEITGDRYFTLTKADDETEGGDGFEGPVDAYAALWDSINGPGAWEANPWIVAVTFTVARHNIDAEAPHA